MSEFSNLPDECPMCGSEYDTLIEVSEQTPDNGVSWQTQGKANHCLYWNPNGAFVFQHFTEKYL